MFAIRTRGGSSLPVTLPSVGASSQAVQLIIYTWDQLGNLIQRSDYENQLTEKYAYDELNRLTAITLPSNANAVENSFSYDTVGNMLTKEDVGTFTYPPVGSGQPHGVQSITYAGGGGGTSYTYGQDGNVTAGAGRTVTWKPSNMPASITYAGSTVSFTYDADHNRVLQSAPEGLTVYLPDGELFFPASGGSPVFHTYFEIGGERVAEAYGPHSRRQHHYFHNDDQNSVNFVTDDSFNCSTGCTMPAPA